jgi:mRNA interferase HigB
MHLIPIANLKEDAAIYPDADSFACALGDRPIKNWFKTVENADWQNLEEVRQSFKDAEAVGHFTVFNIKGNNYRLIVGIDYERQIVYYKYFLTHADYSKDKWKNDPYF